MESIILYTIGCPKCEVLKKKLNKSGIIYSICDDEKVMEELKIKTLPVLSVNGNILEFEEAVNFVNSRCV